ncbi:MAG: hypothetical protein ACJ79V_24800, partial [Myxococcales bacterium]
MTNAIGFKAGPLGAAESKVEHAGAVLRDRADARRSRLLQQRGASIFVGLSNESTAAKKMDNHSKNDQCRTHGDGPHRQGESEGDTAEHADDGERTRPASLRPRKG